MSNKNRIGYVAITLVAALLTTVATVPLKYAAAQNATSSQTDEGMAENMIKARIDQLKAEHPVLTGILNNVQSMNATETLGAIIGIHALERILDAHAMNILLHKVAGVMRNAMG